VWRSERRLVRRILGAPAWWGSEGAAPLPAYETELGEAATELGQPATELGDAATEFWEEYDGGARGNDEVSDHHEGERGRT